MLNFSLLVAILLPFLLPFASSDEETVDVAKEELFRIRLYQASIEVPATDGTEIILEIDNRTEAGIVLAAPPFFMRLPMSSEMPRASEAVDRRLPQEGSGYNLIIRCWVPGDAPKQLPGSSGKVAWKIWRVAGDSSDFRKISLPRTLFSPGPCIVQAALLKDSVLVAKSQMCYFRGEK